MAECEYGYGAATAQPPNGFAALYERYAGRGMHYAYSLLTNRTDSEDVVHEAFYRLLARRMLPKDRSDSSLADSEHVVPDEANSTLVLAQPGSDAFAPLFFAGGQEDIAQAPDESAENTLVSLYRTSMTTKRNQSALCDSLALELRALRLEVDVLSLEAETEREIGDRIDRLLMRVKNTKTIPVVKSLISPEQGEVL